MLVDIEMFDCIVIKWVHVILMVSVISFLCINFDVHDCIVRVLTIIKIGRTHENKMSRCLKQQLLKTHTHLQRTRFIQVVQNLLISSCYTCFRDFSESWHLTDVENVSSHKCFPTSQKRSDISKFLNFDMPIVASFISNENCSQPCC